jgi:hypothetical protein
VISLADAMPETKSLPTIESAIRIIRGQRVMLDSDLARFYGVEVRRLNEQYRRNIDRFPEDFAFALTHEEFAILKSQIATSSWGGKRKLPVAFTEHGVIMLASVLSSPVAVEASVRIVRAFVRLRNAVATSGTELVAKLLEIEKRLGAHDDAIAQLFSALRQLLAEPKPSPNKEREIGFHMHEDGLDQTPLVPPHRKTVRYR